MKVIVIKSKKNTSKTGMACLTYFHGGGAVALKPEHLNGCLSKICLSIDFVVFNVDYTLAPEAKTPGGFRDGVAAVKYVNQHAADYGADPSMQSIGGDSGGGWIAIGTCILLLREEAQLA